METTNDNERRAGNFGKAGGTGDNRDRVEQEVDYKDARLLSRFISERGKIIPSRINNQSLKRQRTIAKAIKRARILALIPFVVK